MTSTLYDLIQNFVMGGIIISSVSYVGTFLSPLLGAILWSFPVSLLPALYFMNKNNKSNKYLAQFTLSTTYALILLVLSTILLSYYLAHNKEDGIEMPIIKTSSIWFFASIIFYYTVKYFDLENKFM